MGLAPRQWIILFTFYTIYLIFGACVFYHLEHGLETERRAQELQARIDINELLVSYASPDDIQIQKLILNRVSSYCNKPVTDYREDEYVEPYQWTFYHAVFFAFIVCSTLGYGNITPTNTFGRYFLIFYALIGMPVNMILYTYMGDYFGKNFTKIYRKYKAYKFAQTMHENENGTMPPRWSMICQITLSLLLPSMIILIFLPSMIFTYFEGWDYSISVYYSFVTMTTIGFGDFVPTFNYDQERKFGVYFVFYQIFVLVWFVVGLCYILMLIGFIARGMQSKKLSRFEKQLAENIKLTHQRIWSGVSKDVGYLRRILNEIHIMRVRPVFTEPNEVQMNFRLNRSQSCPEFTLDDYKSPIPRRKRAQSVNFFNDDKYVEEIEQRPLQLQSRHSESNLMRIDRHKTFNQQNVRDNTGDVLAQVVFALNNFTSNVEETVGGAPPSGTASSGGIDLFSDESILEDEWSVVTAPNEKMPRKFRSRAKSLNPQISKISNSVEAKTPQFTWSGDNNDIQDYINAQVKNQKKVLKKLSKKDTNGIVINIEKPKDVVEVNETKNVGTNRRMSILNAFNNVFKRRNTVFNSNTETVFEPNDTIVNIEQPKGIPMKTSISPAFDRKMSIKGDGFKKLDYKRRYSILSNQSVSSEQVLENTTIADLIRAIETAHIKNMALDSRRFSHAPRRGSVSFSSPLETPPSAGSRTNPPKSSMAIPRSRILTKRQNSSPNRFSVTPVLDSPSSAVSLSPIIQRRIRRFSAVPATTMMPPRRSSASLSTTPLAPRRTQFKQTISPLAMPPTSATPFGVVKNPKLSMLPKNSTKTIDFPEN